MDTSFELKLVEYTYSDSLIFDVDIRDAHALDELFFCQDSCTETPEVGSGDDVSLQPWRRFLPFRGY